MYFCIIIFTCYNKGRILKWQSPTASCTKVNSCKSILTRRKFTSLYYFTVFLTVFKAVMLLIWWSRHTQRICGKETMIFSIQVHFVYLQQWYCQHWWHWQQQIILFLHCIWWCPLFWFTLLLHLYGLQPACSTSIFVKRHLQSWKHCGPTNSKGNFKCNGLYAFLCYVFEDQRNVIWI